MNISRLALAALVWVALPASAQLSAQILPDKSSFEEVFAASHRFFPGQRLRIRVDGQVDANHRYWQDRECSWFGLKCKYVNREASNLLGVDRLPLLFALDPNEGLTKPEHVNQAEWYGNPSVKHFRVAQSGTYDFVLEIPNSDSSVDAFSTGTTLRAVVADKYDKAVAINRGQCHNRPPQCSSGAFKVTVEVSNEARIDHLKALLKKRRSAADIINRKVLDPLFVQDPGAKAQIATALFDHANEWHKEATDEGRRSYLAFASQASGLDPSRADILNAIAGTYIALGEFTEATKSIDASLAVAEKQYSGPGSTTPDVVLTLSEAKGMKASIWAQQRAGVVATDLMVSVSLYRESAKYCFAEAELPTVAPINKQKLFTCAKDRLIDAGRTLAMLRSRENLILAERILSDAQVAAKRAVDEGGGS